MRPVTLVMPYYENPSMLARQQDEWSRLPADIRANLHVVVVDDGSPEHPAQPVWRDCGLASAQLYRCLVDVRWNWIFCRNLAVAQASTEWVLMTDIDHVIPAETWRRVMEGPLEPRRAYKFSRVDAPDMTPTLDKRGQPKPHPNTWLMTRQMFDAVGGYDERLSGLYGTDGEFRDRVSMRAEIVVLPEHVIRYSREVVPDASTTRYQRKAPSDRLNVARIVAQRNAARQATKRLTFPWERVA